MHSFTVKLIEDIDINHQTIIAISPDGEDNKNYFGIPDWMYEGSKIILKNQIQVKKSFM